MGGFNAGSELAVRQPERHGRLDGCLVNTVDEVSLGIGDQCVPALQRLRRVQCLQPQTRFGEASVFLIKRALYPVCQPGLISGQSILLPFQSPTLTRPLTRSAALSPVLRLRSSTARA